MQPLSQKTSGFLRKPHSIQLVELGPVSDGQRHIKLTVDDTTKKRPLTDVYRGLRISE